MNNAGCGMRNASKEFIRRVLADYEKTENMAKSYRTIKATYPEGTKCPTYNGCVKAYERAKKMRNAECGMRNAECEMRKAKCRKSRRKNGPELCGRSGC